MDCVICAKEMRHKMNDLFICDQCGLVSSDIMPDPSIYDRSYTIKYERYEATEKGYLINKYRVDTVSRFTTDGPVLDFGCGVGSFVDLWNMKRGYSAVGFDLNPYGGFTDITVLFQKNKIVTMWDSVEHLPNPVKVIKGLKPNFIFICTPSTDDYTKEFTTWRHYMPNEHCHYFNAKSLTALLNVCGYDQILEDYGESELRDSGGSKNIITVGGITRGTH